MSCSFIWKRLDKEEVIEKRILGRRKEENRNGEQGKNKRDVRKEEKGLPVHFSHLQFASAPVINWHETLNKYHLSQGNVYLHIKKVAQPDVKDVDLALPLYDPMCPDLIGKIS